MENALLLRTHSITLPAQDFAGASLSLLSPANLKIFKTVAKLYADHYPEFMVLHATPSRPALSTRGFPQTNMRTPADVACHVCCRCHASWFTHQ